MQENGWTFYRAMPAPLQTWQIAVGSLLFVAFVFGIVMLLRRKAENKPGSLRLNSRRDSLDSARLR
jgi:hypothetical protein